MSIDLPTTASFPAARIGPGTAERTRGAALPARDDVLGEIVSADRPIRTAVWGPASSGKSWLLRTLAAASTRAGVTITWLRADTAIEAVPPGTLLLVDDAHLLAEDRLEALVRRADDADAALGIAARPWPSREILQSLSRRLERSQPAVLLGDVTRARLRDAWGTDEECAGSILELTGGVEWLVRDCTSAHDDHDCPAHDEMRAAVRPRIVHRLMSTDPAVRALVDDLSLGIPPTAGGAVDALLAQALAEGLLTSSLHPPALITEVVRSVVSVTRLVEVIERGTADALADEHLASALSATHDPRLCAALVARAHDEIGARPALASALLGQACRCGADPDELAVTRADAAWRSGDLDTAGRLVDDLLRRDEGDTAHADLAAAIWAERGMMALADATYRATSSGSTVSGRLAAVGTGRPQAPASVSAGAAAVPSTRDAALDLLDRGVAASVSPDADGALALLQRASELFTASGDASPLVELPAVIAAIVAVGCGDLPTAHTIIGDALDGRQGGDGRRSRLLLWSSWIALQRERPADARTALDLATGGGPLSPRDELLAGAVTIGLARRYDDTAALAALWESSRAAISRTEPDLYSLLPFGELVIAAARLGDADTMRPAFESAVRLTVGLASPSLWATPLHWVGIQRGILLNRPDLLVPHARALVEAAPRNRPAAHMARAGRVWTAVLAGSVDVDAVEEAARGLGEVGLAWDGARLAGHGAGRSDDRRVIARLLACARELHPRDPARGADQTESVTTAASDADGLLSEREREVAELVVQGKTYAEIGAAIFISPRTAEHHIAHIRRRLGASSRSDLMAKLRVALSVDGDAGTATDGARR